MSNINHEPVRVQWRRTKGWRKGEFDVYVGRPTKWGNPYRVGPTLTPHEAVTRYRDDLIAGRLRVTVADVGRELRGRNLGCWCALDEPCHASVLLELANADLPGAPA